MKNKTKSVQRIETAAPELALMEKGPESEGKRQYPAACDDSLRQASGCNPLELGHRSLFQALNGVRRDESIEDRLGRVNEAGVFLASVGPAADANRRRPGCTTPRPAYGSHAMSGTVREHHRRPACGRPFESRGEAAARFHRSPGGLRSPPRPRRGALEMRTSGRFIQCVPVPVVPVRRKRTKRPAPLPGARTRCVSQIVDARRRADRRLAMVRQQKMQRWMIHEEQTA
jgi:hypothetical protein